MKIFKISFLSIFFIIAFTANAQNQVSNAGFELWENVATNEDEPVNWNSFRTNAGTYATVARAKQVDKSSDIRPGSTGTTSAVIWARWATLAVANGNLTTGQIQAGSTTPANAANHNKTIRANAAHNMPFTATPDSLTVWTKYVPGNTAHQARVAAVIHGDYDYKDPSATADENYVVGKATLNYSATEDKGWQRLSIPFDYDFTSNDPQYILITFTTNMTPGVGTTAGRNGAIVSDSVYIDDMFMIYNPTLTAENTSEKSTFVSGEEIEISYTITGTMSPYNLNAEANVVRLELSDATGSFDDAIVLDEATTDESGVFTVSLPEEMEIGDGYKLRVITTNYPMISDEISISIEDNTPVTYLVTVSSEGTDATGTGYYEEGETVTIFAGTPPNGKQFTEWIVEPQSVELDDTQSATTTFSMPAEAVTVTAKFDNISALEGIVAENTVSVYPNPVSTTLFVKSAEIEKIGIYAVNGLKIAEEQVFDGGINVSSYESGTYIIVVETKDGYKYRQLFVKR